MKLITKDKCHFWEKIAIFRALPLGDLLCGIPAFRALRSAFPAAHIALIGLPWASSFTRRFSYYFDEFIPFPGFPGLSDEVVGSQQSLRFLKEIQTKKYDCILQLHGSGVIANPLVILMGAKYVGGFYPREANILDAGISIPYPESLSEVERLLEVAKVFGPSETSVDLEFPLLPEDFEEYTNLRLPLLPGSYVCIHPGARKKPRQWSANLFARLGDQVAQWGYDVVLTGVAEERVLTQKVASMMRHSSVDLAGQTTLGSLAVLLRNSRLLVANDTGVSHLAAALKVPSVILSLLDEKNRKRWSPLNVGLHKVVNARLRTATKEAITHITEFEHNFRFSHHPF